MTKLWERDGETLRDRWQHHASVAILAQPKADVGPFICVLLLVIVSVGFDVTMPKRRAPTPDGDNRRTGGVRQRLRQGTDEVGEILQMIDMLAARLICVLLLIIVSVGSYVFYCFLFVFLFGICLLFMLCCLLFVFWYSLIVGFSCLFVYLLCQYVSGCVQAHRALQIALVRCPDLQPRLHWRVFWWSSGRGAWCGRSKSNVWWTKPKRT